MMRAFLNSPLIDGLARRIAAGCSYYVLIGARESMRRFRESMRRQGAAASLDRSAAHLVVLWE
jgi:hypothetical protein